MPTASAAAACASAMIMNRIVTTRAMPGRAAVLAFAHVVLSNVCAIVALTSIWCCGMYDVGLLVGILAGISIVRASALLGGDHRLLVIERRPPSCRCLHELNIPDDYIVDEHFDPRVGCPLHSRPLPVATLRKIPP